MKHRLPGRDNFGPLSALVSLLSLLFYVTACGPLSYFRSTQLGSNTANEQCHIESTSVVFRNICGWLFFQFMILKSNLIGL